MAETAVSVKIIADSLNAQVFGEESTLITGIKPLGDAGKNDLTFFSPTDKKSQAVLHSLASDSSAGAILVKEYDQQIKSTQIVCDNPLQGVITLARTLVPQAKPEAGVHPSAAIGEGCEIGENCRVGAYAVLGKGVKIGPETIVHPNVVIYDNVSIGSKCVIHSGAVLRENISLGNSVVVQNGTTIGTDGFGYIPHPELGHVHIPHIGTLVLEDNVEIGANSAIDRGTLGETRIGSQTKIDNLVQIGHNNQIGKRTLICGQVGIGGSCNIGSDVTLAGCVGVADHIKIDDGVRTAGMTGVSRDLEGNGKRNTDYAGLPPVKVSAWRRQAAAIIKLPQLLKDIRDLAKRIDKLEKRDDQ